MRKKNLVLAALAVPFMGLALAQPPRGGGQQPGQAQAGAMQERMQERMQEMRQHMERIHQTQDPEERRRLMREHMERMHEGMMAMRQSMQNGQGPAQGPQCPQGDTQCRLEQLQMRQQRMSRQMGMMQMMMEQMMEQMQLRNQMMDETQGGASAEQ